MPKYTLSCRFYAWPGYQKPGSGELETREIEATSDEHAVQLTSELPEFKSFKGHDYHRANEQDYHADFALTRALDLPAHTIIEIRPAGHTSSLPANW